MGGYIPKRTKEIVGPWEIPEGSEPFRATIVTSLTFAEIDAIPFGESATFGQLFPAIAPYVVAWNAMGRNAETGEYEPLPPPAEAGPDVLRLVEPMITTFLAIKLRTVHLGDDTERPKEPSGPPHTSDTPAGTSAPNSDSTAPAMNRRSRTTTTSTPGTT